MATGLALLLLICPAMVSAAGKKGGGATSYPASPLPQVFSAKDCLGFFGWDHTCLLARLRDPYYFGISTRDASDQQLLNYIKANEQAVAALLLQVDYGRDLQRFVGYQDPILLAENERLLDQTLGRAVNTVQMLGQLASVLNALNETAASAAVSESLSALQQILFGIQIYERFAQVLISSDQRQLLILYFQDRTEGMSKGDAWRQLWSDFSGVLLQIGRAQGLSADQLSNWFEAAFVAYRLVGYSDSNAIRLAEGRALASLASGNQLRASEVPEGKAQLPAHTTIMDEFNGSTLGTANGISYAPALDGEGAVFRRSEGSYIQYPQGIPRQGTLEWWIRVDSGYWYQNFVLRQAQTRALIFTTDVSGGDVTWPGSAWLWVSANGDISFYLATRKYQSPPADAAIGRGTKFRFGQWHSIGISYGSQGQAIEVDGQLVAAEPGNTQWMGAGGNHSLPLDVPTIGESVSHFWRPHQYSGGFDGIVDRFRASTAQRDWVLSASPPSAAAPEQGPGTNPKTIPTSASDEAVNLLVGRNWYCTDNYRGMHRFVFSANGTFTSAFFTPTPNNLKYWNSTAPIHYAIVSPTQVRILDSSFNPPFFTVRYLSPEQLRFSQGNSSYACSHVPPPEDTPQNAAAVAAERAAEKKFFDGKWVTKDRLQSVEFFPDGTCKITSHVKGNTTLDISMYKGTVRAKSSLYSGGRDIQCGMVGAFSRVAPNRIEFSVQHASVSLYRIPRAPAAAPALLQSTKPRPTSAPAAAQSAQGCSGATDLGYSLSFNGQTYHVQAVTDASGKKSPIFLDQQGGLVRDATLLNELELAAWTRENVIASSATRVELAQKDTLLPNLVGTLEAMNTYQAVQDLLARGMAVSLEAAVTGGVSLPAAVGQVSVGELEHQLQESPHTMLVLMAKNGLLHSRVLYDQLNALLYPQNATTLDAGRLNQIFTLLIQAHALELANEALQAALLPQHADQLTQQALNSAMSQVLLKLQPISPSTKVTLQVLQAVQQGVADASDTVPALSGYRTNWNLALNLAQAYHRQIANWATEAATACGSTTAGSVPATAGVNQTLEKLARINKKVVGKWWSGNWRSYIEFLPTGACSVGYLYPDGKWHVQQATFAALGGESFQCTSGVILRLLGANKAVSQPGMSEEPPTYYYRGIENIPNIPTTLSVAAAQRILDQQINMTTANNTLLTCRACYDPSDKEENDKAPLVSTYPGPLIQFLVQQGYIRANSEKDAPNGHVFTGKAKRSKYYGRDGLRFANFKNPRILVSKIVDPGHVPIEYEFVPTELTMGLFGRVYRLKSFASFSYKDEAWRVCIGCRP